MIDMTDDQPRVFFEETFEVELYDKEKAFDLLYNDKDLRFYIKSIFPETNFNYSYSRDVFIFKLCMLVKYEMMEEKTAEVVVRIFEVLDNDANPREN